MSKEKLQNEPKEGLKRLPQEQSQRLKSPEQELFEKNPHTLLLMLQHTNTRLSLDKKERELFKDPVFLEFCEGFRNSFRTIDEFSLRVLRSGAYGELFYLKDLLTRAGLDMPRKAKIKGNFPVSDKVDKGVEGQEEALILDEREVWIMFNPNLMETYQIVGFVFADADEESSKNDEFIFWRYMPIDRVEKLEWVEKYN